jgi:hypothetical protein
MDSKLAGIYYTHKGYWKGSAEAVKVFEGVARAWLKKQALWQICLQASRHIPEPKSDASMPNEFHQADLLFLPHDSLHNK